jgi:hypothetical protein
MRRARYQRGAGAPARLPVGARRYRAGVARGRLITIEGHDGAGKSTHAAAVAAVDARWPRD